MNPTRRTILPYNPKLKAIARVLRQNMSKAEVVLWKSLRDFQMLGYDFDRQRPIDNYIVDFYCKDLFLVIEVDGPTHDWEEVAVNDTIRQAKIESFGVAFLRFTNEEILKQLDSVLAAIQGWIEENAPNIDLNYEQKLTKHLKK